MPRSHILGYLVAGPNGEMSPGTRRYNWVWYRPANGTQGLGRALTDSKGRVHRYSLSRGDLSAQRLQNLLSDAEAQLPAPFAAAVAAESQPFLQAIFDFETPRMANGRVGLLGDAAFVARPHTAMGVAKAAGDALALRTHLATTPDVRSALRAYEVYFNDIRVRGFILTGAPVFADIRVIHTAFTRDKITNIRSAWPGLY